ncbi:MAG: SpoIIIAH-like family protein [Roseburia sp.]|nr:SpoIIIAH-like family protein [Roseburia sp.]
MSKKKKIIVLASMVALLVLTGCLNYFLNRPATSQNVGAENTQVYSDYFTMSRTDRSASRSETVMYYEAIKASEASSEEAKASAEKELAALVACMETEQRLETLIKALGFSDCLVTVGEENVNVILKSDALTDQEVAQVLDVVLTETDKTAFNVRIKPVEA